MLLQQHPAPAAPLPSSELSSPRLAGEGRTCRQHVAAVYEIFLFSANSAAICSSSLIISAEVGDVRRAGRRCVVNTSSSSLDRAVGAKAAPRRCVRGWHKHRQCVKVRQRPLHC